MQGLCNLQGLDSLKKGPNNILDFIYKEHKMEINFKKLQEWTLYVEFLWTFSLGF